MAPLHTLSLVGLAVGDDALPGLAAAPRLARLDLSATDVTDPAPLAALPPLRELGLAGARLGRAGRASVEALAARGVLVRR